MTYVGIPLEDNPRLDKLWDPVLENIRKRCVGERKGFFLRGARDSYSLSYGKYLCILHVRIQDLSQTAKGLRRCRGNSFGIVRVRAREAI